jgi:hypothetical protein
VAALAEALVELVAEDRTKKLAAKLRRECLAQLRAEKPTDSEVKADDEFRISVFLEGGPGLHQLEEAEKQCFVSEIQELNGSSASPLALEESAAKTEHPESDHPSTSSGASTPEESTSGEEDSIVQCTSEESSIVASSSGASTPERAVRECTLAMYLLQCTPGAEEEEGSAAEGCAARNDFHSKGRGSGKGTDKSNSNGKGQGKVASFIAALNALDASGIRSPAPIRLHM